MSKIVKKCEVESAFKKIRVLQEKLVKLQQNQNKVLSDFQKVIKKARSK